MRGERIQIPLKRAIIAPPAKRHLNGVSLAGKLWPNIECWLGSFAIFHRIWSSISKKPFAGGGGGPDPSPHSGSANVKHTDTGKCMTSTCSLYGVSKRSNSDDSVCTVLKIVS